MRTFPDLESEVCDVFNATRVALDYVSAQLLSVMDNDEANTAAYILHDAANRAALLKMKFYDAMSEHHAEALAGAA